MSISYITSSSFYKAINREASLFRFYSKTRYQDVTSLLKSDPLLFALKATCWIGVACAIYSFAPLALTIFATTYMLYDYLSYTYIPNPAPKSEAFFHLFRHLRELATYTVIDDELFNALKVQSPEFARQGERLYEESKDYKNDDRPALLFIESHWDDSGVFKNDAYDIKIRFNLGNEIGLNQLKEQYKIILIDDVKSADLLKERLNTITNRIHHLWIFAHGTPTSLTFDDHNHVEPENLENLADLLQEKLEDDAQICFFSCSVGQKAPKGESIAQAMSRILPNRTVWAPHHNLSVTTIDLTSDGLRPNFWRHRSRWEILLEKMGNLCTFRFKKKVETLANITSQFQNGTEQPIECEVTYDPTKYSSSQN